MIRFCRGFLLAVCVFSAPAAEGREERLQEIRIEIPPGGDVGPSLAGRDADLLGRGDGDVRVALPASGVDALRREGWRVEVIHDDLEAFYAGRQTGRADFGIWHTYSEAVAELNLLHAQFPEITTEPFSIGRSFEGREIWAIKISDNPDEDEDEPEVLFDSIHHAREIMSLEAILAFARYLCENHGVDPLASHLVDNREIYFVPVVNPDGFVYNEIVRPEGGGIWRKSRRPNDGGCFGVDLNRNYPFRWGNNSGSSANPCSETYRGSSPASEPETQAMVDFISSRRFVTHDSFHSVVGAILIPWCDTESPTPDDELFRQIARERTAQNNYVFGQCPEILYIVSGGMIDWAYGEQFAKPKILSFSTEVGGTGFWPDPAERDGLIRENLPSMLYLTQVAGPTLSMEGIAVASGDDSRLDPGETAEIVVAVRSTGVLAGAGSAEVRLSCDDPYITLLDATADLGEIEPGAVAENRADPFRFAVDPRCPPGRRSPFTLVIVAEGALSVEEAFHLDVGSVRAIVSNDFEIPGDAWQVDPTQSTSVGAFVRVDPYPTPYQPGDDTTPAPGVHAWITGQNHDEANDDVDDGVAASRSPIFDLSDRQHARLRMRYFHGQRDGGDDPGGDWFAIDVSPDGGESWVSLVRMDDQASAAEWRTLDIDLAALIPLTDAVCFRIQVADGPVERDVVEGGIDDFEILESVAPNTAPEPPVAETPADGSAGLGGWVALSVAGAVDPDEDPLTYGFRVHRAGDWVDPVASVDGVPQVGRIAAWNVDRRLERGTYVWRAFADDGQERSYFSAPASFTVTDSSGTGDSLAAALVAAPNPHREGDIRFRVHVPVSSTSALAVFDLQGRRVRRLQLAPSASGWREVRWDGRNDAGRSVAAGSYFVRLWTPRETRTLRVVRLP